MMELTCSFCGRKQREVRKLIAGPSAYACDECSFVLAGMCHQAGLLPERDPALTEQEWKAFKEWLESNKGKTSDE